MTTKIRARKISTLALVLGLGVVSLGLSGCETDEDRQLAAGQACLDQATTSSQADTCVSLVQGLTSSESYLLRCSANFVAQGFTASRIASSVDKVKNSGNQDQMTGMMSFLVFKSAGTNNTADNAVTNCQKSGVRSMLRLATAAQLATTIAGVGGVDPNGADPATAMANAIATFQGSATPTQQTQLGNTAILASQVYCSEGSSYASTQVCTILNGAVNSGGSAQNIGQQLIAQLQSH